MLDQLGNVIGEGVVVVTVPRLARAAETPAVEGDGAVAVQFRFVEILVVRARPTAGLGQLPGLPVDEAEASAPFVTLITLTAATLMDKVAGSFNRSASATASAAAAKEHWEEF